MTAVVVSVLVVLTVLSAIAWRSRRREARRLGTMKRSAEERIAAQQERAEQRRERSS